MSLICSVTMNSDSSSPFVAWLLLHQYRAISRLYISRKEGGDFGRTTVKVIDSSAPPAWPPLPPSAMLMLMPAGPLVAGAIFMEDDIVCLMKLTHSRMIALRRHLTFLNLADWRPCQRQRPRAVTLVQLCPPWRTQLELLWSMNCVMGDIEFSDWPAHLSYLNWIVLV